jgi:TetR/AcrR family transcriptional regulator, copper-responsive repressor
MNVEKRRRGRPATFDRAAALKAAVLLFWRHGYDGTSISMLTEAMGVTPPTLYSAFGSKEQLYCEALDAYQHGDGDDARTSTQKLSAYQVVEAYLRGSAVRLTMSNAGPGCLLLNGSIQCGIDAKGAVKATAAARTKALQRFVTLLHNAQERGEIASSADTLILARFYMGVAQGMAIQAADGASTRELFAFADVALSAWPAGS